MPFSKTGYDTTAGRIENVKPLDLSLKEALISGDLQYHRLGVEKIDQRTAVFVFGGATSEMKIPPFAHPYLVQNFKGQDFLVTDMRLFRGTDREYSSEREFENSVRNRTEFSLAKSRAALNLHWLDPHRDRLRTRFNFASSVFAAWLSQAIAKAYALDFQDQMRITAVGIYYYSLLFTEDSRLTGDAMEIAVIHTIKATKFPAAEVYKLFENIGDINGIEDYCKEVQKVVENVRLQNFNYAMLLTLIRNSWYGTNAKEMLAVAMEHPPTWISIVFATLTERSYKSSALYKLIEMQGKRGNAEEFKMNYLELIRDTVLALEDAEPEIEFKDFKD